MIEMTPSQPLWKVEVEWSPRVVYIRVAVADLDSPQLPFAVFQTDPLESFRQRLAQQDGKAQSIQQLWDEPFTTLKREQQYFVIGWSAVPGASSRIAAEAGLSFGIANPGPEYARWITTKALHRRGELVAWCERVNMRGMQEEMLEVVFSEESMIRLESESAFTKK
ncbi:MAG TPA: hypothetical protein VFA41_12695 [Ktedonobacteraceae bacterium]|jgi:hypothetical protein|nr:hypothetical protein [Ktedonobacteraceae bacterium]